LPPGRDEHDQALEQRLVLMLSNLEYMRVLLEECQAGQRPAETLEAARTLVNHVVEFTEKYAPAEAPPEALAPALAKAGDFYTSAQQLTEQYNGSFLKSVFGLFGKKAPAPDRRRLFQETTQRLLEVLESNFDLYSNWFHAEPAAGNWRETYEVFLADLKRVAEQPE
jgi:hypothetical protein